MIFKIIVGDVFYTENNTAPSESQPSVSWWRYPVRFLKDYSTHIGAARDLLMIVNFGVDWISGIWSLGKKNVPEAKRQEGIR